MFYWTRTPQQPLKKQQSTHPLREEVKTLVSVLESDTEEPWIEKPFTCLENHWLSHKVSNGVVSTTRRWWSDTGISDCFSRHEARIPLISRSSWDSFSSLKYLSITEHKFAKKSLKLSNMTSIEYSTRCHLMFQQRLFLILIYGKQGLLTSCCASWPDVFFKNTLYA